MVEEKAEKSVHGGRKSRRGRSWGRIKRRGRSWWRREQKRQIIMDEKTEQAGHGAGISRRQVLLEVKGMRQGTACRPEQRTSRAGSYAGHADPSIEQCRAGS
jgi:hypothetical protein